MVTSSTNLFVVFFVVGYNNLTVVGSRFFLYFYPILVPLPPTVILAIVVVDVVDSRYLAGPLPSLLSLVAARGSIPSLPQSHMYGSCAVLSWKRRLLCVTHLYPQYVCVLFPGIGVTLPSYVVYIISA